jgi:hypothetical protein
MNIFQPTFHHTKNEKKVQRSNIRFQWDFKKELSKLILSIEENILSKKWCVITDTAAWNNNLKIWLHIDEYGEDKIVNFIFRYHHEDAWYGFIYIEMVLSEVSKKPKSHFLGKYHLKESIAIQNSIWATIEELYI